MTSRSDMVVQKSCIVVLLVLQVLLSGCISHTFRQKDNGVYVAKLPCGSFLVYAPVWGDDPEAHDEGWDNKVSDLNLKHALTWKFESIDGNAIFYTSASTPPEATIVKTKGTYSRSSYNWTLGSFCLSSPGKVRVTIIPSEEDREAAFSFFTRKRKIRAVKCVK